MTYSHRNGETEPPTVKGAYFFEGIYTEYKRYTRLVSDDIGGVEMSVVQRLESRQKVREFLLYVDAEYNTILYIGTENEAALSDFEGQWWGPVSVMSPWGQEVPIDWKGEAESEEQ